MILTAKPYTRLYHKLTMLQVHRCTLLLAIIVSAIISTGCHQDELQNEQQHKQHKREHNSASVEHTDNIDTINRASSLLWAQGLESIEQAIHATTPLNTAISELLQHPNPDTLQQAKTQWQYTFSATQAMLPYLHLHHPDSPTLNRLINKRFAIIAWPIQPGYIDRYQEHIHSGIVQDFTLKITSATLRQQHGITSHTEAVLGLHSMEYLLWGANEQQTIDALTKDQVLPPAFKKAQLTLNDTPNNRRRKLLKLQGQLLLSDLHALAKQWQSNQALSLAYFKLPAAQRLLTLNQSVADYLLSWSDYLSKMNIKANPNDVVDIAPQNFASYHLLGMQQGMKSIEEMYFLNQAAFAQPLFDDTTRENIAMKLKQIIADVQQAALQTNATSPEAVEKPDKAAQPSIDLEEQITALANTLLTKTRL